MIFDARKNTHKTTITNITKMNMKGEKIKIRMECKNGKIIYFKKTWEEMTEILERNKRNKNIKFYLIGKSVIPIRLVIKKKNQ